MKLKNCISLVTLNYNIEYILHVGDKEKILESPSKKFQTKKYLSVCLRLTLHQPYALYLVANLSVIITWACKQTEANISSSA